MLDPARLCVHHATLLGQCSMPHFVDVLARHGVRCAGLWRDKVREHGVAETARLLADRGIEVSAYSPVGFLGTRDAGKAARALDDARRALDEAAALRARCAIFVAGGVDRDDRDIDAIRACVVDGLSRIVPHARSVGVTITLEPLHPMACASRSVLSTLKLANDWCDRLAADDAVGIAVDAYGVWWDPDLDVQIARAARRILSFHVSDWLPDTRDLRLDRGMMGDGVIDLPRLRHRVEATGYDGYVEVEIFSERDWWRRDPDDVLRVIGERVQNAV